ncbi:MAG: hypothetical protein HDQ95_05275 [Roseburia sp.]|nr:hypothetical protein [Roseburia sp.]
MYYSMSEIITKLRARKERFHCCVLASSEFGLGTKFIFDYCFRKKKYQEQLHEVIRNILNKYDAGYVQNVYEEKNKLMKEHFKIWFMWWQGIESMPKIIQACYNSVINCSAQYEVIFIWEGNIDDYIKIPNTIKEKHKKNIISNTALSDYIRISLLKKEGGLWLDASIYCMKKIQNVEKYRFLTGKKRGGRKWTTFFLGVNETNNEMFTLLKYYLEKYWHDENVLIDYFFTDRCIEYLYENNSDIKEMIDSVEENNKEIFKLLTLLSEPYDERYMELLRDGNLFQKISQKKDYRLYKNGKPTFGNVLLNCNSNKL